MLRHQLLRLTTEPQDPDAALPGHLLKADDRAVDFVLGRPSIDARLLPFTRRVAPAAHLHDLALPADLVERLANASSALVEGGAVVLLEGPPGAGKRQAAEAVCAAIGRPLLVADMRDTAASALPAPLLGALLRREARMHGAALYLDRYETLLDSQNERARVLAGELATPDMPVFVGSAEVVDTHDAWTRTRRFTFRLSLPDIPTRRRLWEEALRHSSHLPDADGELRAVADPFVLSAAQIEDAVRLAADVAVLRPPDQRTVTPEDLRAAARAQSNQSLRRLASKVEPLYDWSDIVLSGRALQQLRAVCASVKYRHVVYGHWGFERKLAAGKGLNVLFAGSTGTGKTMAAQILARELGLDLYKIDLSAVVSKYIGETEKNLRRIFEDARSSNAILFFDEADALFGKRSEVKDAHDRYANIEVAYLLQQVEAYEGVVILATNLSNNLDDAFARRMHHTVEFPFPDAALRERIWRGVFPADAPLDADVDWGFLARQFELAGGNIRNIALAAAFLAAEDGTAVRMEHLIRATARELQKLGKLPAKAEFREFYELIRESR